MLATLLPLLFACAPVDGATSDTGASVVVHKVVTVTVDYECGDGTEFVWPDKMPIQLTRFVLYSTGEWVVGEPPRWNAPLAWVESDDDGTDCDLAAKGVPIVGGRIVYAYEE